MVWSVWVSDGSRVGGEAVGRFLFVGLLVRSMLVWCCGVVLDENENEGDEKEEEE